MSVVGIDFGDESSYVAVARQGGIETVDNDYSLRATPSFVAFGGKQQILGVAAKNQHITNVKNTIYGFKRLVGRKFNEPMLDSKEVARLPFDLSPTKNGGIGVNVNYLGEMQNFSAEQITAMFLSKLKETAEQAIKTSVHDCVLSCPSYFTNAERQGLLVAAAMSGLNVLRLFNDTTATALSYGIYKQDLPGEDEPPRNVVFVDCGHSALQVFACAFNKGKLKMLCSTYDPTVGGRDFTTIIATHFCDEFKKRYEIDPRENHRAYIRLSSEVEKLKKQMSANSIQLPFNIECLMDGKDVSSSLTREKFEAMASELFERVDQCLKKCLEYSGLKLDEIYAVEIVGGASSTPEIKHLIERAFCKVVSTTQNQDKAVAHGCALMCAILSPVFKVKEFSITDVQQFPIKIIFDESSISKGEMEVFPQYHPIPSTKLLTFHRREPFTLIAAYNSTAPFLNPEIGTYTISNVKAKIKVKARVNINGMFSMRTASGYEKYDQEDEKDYLGVIKSDCICKITLHYENDRTQAMKQVAYEIGSLDIKVFESNVYYCFPEEPILNQSQLVQAFSGVTGETLTSVTLHVSQIPTRSVIVIRKERLIISDDETRADQMTIEDHYYADLIGFNPQLCKGFRDRAASIFRLDIFQFVKGDKILQLKVGVLHHNIYDNKDSIPPIVESSKPARNILRHFFESEDGNVEENEVGTGNRKEDLIWFYGQLKEYHDGEELAVATGEIYNANLVPELRDYQKKAVAWMMTREAYTSAYQDLRDYILGPLFVQIQLSVDSSYENHPDYPLGGTVLAYFNPKGGYLTWEIPEIPPMPSGGILADEMGLGKTVEVLTLILMNPRSDPFDKESKKADRDSGDEEAPLTIRKKETRRKSIFVGSKSFFECICGEDEGHVRKNIVICIQCGSSQHATCVRYNTMKNEELDRKSYLCPHCITLAEPVQSKTTLIISPMSISHQWISEIERHVKGEHLNILSNFNKTSTFPLTVKDKHLNILLYEGVSKQGYIPPSQLAAYDIIISTYTVLSAELCHAELPHSNSADGRRLRHAKRFLSIPSPLPSVEWWRVCLDEAQMVESGLTRMAIMARRLKAVHRWCVTGTPINKGLDDLRGLIAFLGVHPLEDESWWSTLVSEPFYRRDFTFLNELFGQLVWRTGKHDVLDQLRLPPQSVLVHVLKFSALEKHFYKRQLDVCGKSTLQKIARIGLPNLDVKLSTLNRQVFNSLLEPLLQLRQACVHPQMVRGESLILAKNGQNLTMEELLDQLIRKVIIQCADEQRKIVSSLNGMASIYFIMENFVEASKKYREVLELAATHENKFMTDTLQMLHALENLADILDMNAPGVGFTLRDDTLRDRAKDLRQKYLAKHEVGVTRAREVGATATREVREQMEKCETNKNKKSTWFTDIIRQSHRDGKQEDLITTIKKDLKAYASKRKDTDTGSLANLFEHGAGLEDVLIGKITEMESMRDSVLLSLEDLGSRDPSSYVNAAVNCHLRSQLPQKGKYLCSLCSYHEQFQTYECILFREQTFKTVARTGRNRQKFIMGALNLDDEFAANLHKEQEEEELLQTTEHVNFLGHRKGEGWGDSDMEKALKIILNFGKLNKVDPTTIENGKNHMRFLELAKKEFRVLRDLWTQIFDQVSAFDEIAQATTRLRLRTEHDIDQPGPSSAMVSKQAMKELTTTDTQLQKLRNIHILEAHELDYKLQGMMDEYVEANSKIAVHLGQYMFLNSLKRNGYGRNGTFNLEECSVCSNPLGHEWSVLICGHSYCTDCVRRMCKEGSQSFLCPICRIQTNLKQVFYVDTKADSKDDKDKDVAGPSTSKVIKEVKGSHSTKVEAIIETLLKLQETHPGEKVLIFSTWSDMLTIIGRAMEENYIKHIFLSKSSGSSGKDSFQAVTDRFKKREEIQVLLMELSTGSKGLNLIEATHVFLVEPILNLASELQAIGRVHRIGQTKKTFVHRFYVKDTIEEQLFNMLKDQDVSVDEEASLTVANLRELFVS